MTSTTSEDFFEAKYRGGTDPWDFATSAYEINRYARILRALAGRRFALGYEPGCSIGVLTESLAAICDRVESCDFSATAVGQAQRRCRSLRNVHIHHASLADFAPQGADLYVFSEIGYYLTHNALETLLRGHVEVLQPRAVLVACHWRGESADHVLSGDEVHEVIANLPGLVHEYSEQHEQFRLDRWAKREVENEPRHRTYRSSHSGQK